MELVSVRFYRNSAIQCCHATLIFSRIENINLRLQNLINQLDAVCKGKRGYHQVQAQKGPTVQIKPHVDPLRQAQFYERSRLQSEDDLSMALRGEEKRSFPITTTGDMLVLHPAFTYRSGL